MVKRATSFDLAFEFEEHGKPAYRQLYDSLRTRILDGSLRAGMRLPATRDFANLYGLSRGTVVSAFEQLKSEGYLEGKIGSGTYVSRVLPEELLQVAHRSAPATNSEIYPQRRFSNYGKRVELFPNLEPRPTHAFRANMPGLNLFPTSIWTQITTRRLRRISVNTLLGSGPMGHAPLRSAIADYLNTSRGVKCVSEQIAIVSGVQEGLDLAARLLLDPGDRVCMEDPGYTGAAIAFKAVGARISCLPVDEQGMVLDRRRLRGAKLVYVTPGHQFPLGVTMSLARRLEILDWARQSGALILEDDYDSEYRYSGRPIPALQGLDRSGLVLFAGTFSKVLFPSLRLGYLVIPSDLVDRFAATISVTTRHAPLLEQAVLCDFIIEGHFGRHLRRMRGVYAERLEALLDEGRHRLSGLLELSSVEAGLQTVGWLANGISGESATKAAAAKNVEVVSLNQYYHGPMQREGLQLGFAAVDSREIRRGVRDLAAALESAGRRL